MPIYKLKYFNGRGRAEEARLLFAEAGQSYEDIRIEGKDWPSEKPTTPFGQLPVLIVDDKQLAQSMVIMRYLARELKLEPEDSLEKANADMIAETLREAFDKGISFYFEKDETKKAELMKEWFDKTITPVLSKCEKIFSESKKEFLCGQRLTYADIVLMNGFMELELVKPGFTDNFASLKNLSAKVKTRPNIKKWIETRPVTDF